MRPDEVRSFQASHLDWEGKRLDVDGSLGPRTQWALDVARLEPWRQAIIARACSMVGEHESDGDNRSITIDTWNRRAGAPLGSPWCAAFASWCISVEGLPDVREASALALGRRMRMTDLHLPGDVMWFATGGGSGHCGIVIGLGPGEVACVEGNRGNRVALCRRSTAQVRISSPLPIQTFPGIPPGLTLAAVSIEGTR